ncbi:MAG: type VI secretion system baseplate subunit TssE [Anaeromyxobacter sp.]
MAKLSGAGSTGDIESIVSHLRALLNTRQGAAPCSPGYGVMDLADVVHAFPSAGPQLARAIRATILEFEPRLRNVNVRHVSDEQGLVLRFEISGQLAQSKTARTLRFATTVSPGGRFDVAG